MRTILLNSYDDFWTEFFTVLVLARTPLYLSHCVCFRGGWLGVGGGGEVCLLVLIPFPFDKGFLLLLRQGGG